MWFGEKAIFVLCIQGERILSYEQSTQQNTSNTFPRRDSRKDLAHKTSHPLTCLLHQTHICCDSLKHGLHSAMCFQHFTFIFQWIYLDLVLITPQPSLHSSLSEYVWLLNSEHVWLTVLPVSKWQEAMLGSGMWVLGSGARAGEGCIAEKLETDFRECSRGFVL